LFAEHPNVACQTPAFRETQIEYIHIYVCTFNSAAVMIEPSGIGK